MTIRMGRPDADRGQIIVIFALGLVAMVAMVGLVLDGGATFAQQRVQQNAADSAAMAAANTYLLTTDQSSATAAALARSAENGFTHGTNGTTVAVNYDFTNGATIKVDVGSPHRNNFASVMGFTSWHVSTTATALTGIPDTVKGAAPIIFSVNVFGSDGVPLPAYGTPGSPFAFGETNGDVPVSAGDIAWTNYGTGNLNTNEVRQILNGSTVINKTLSFNPPEYIGQHNNGNHTALYSDVQQYLAGTDVVVPVVDNSGYFQGWATFHVVSASGGSSKDVVGYFVNSYQNAKLTVGCSFGQCPRYLGSYVLKLVN